MLLLVSGCSTFSWHLCCAAACTPPGQWGLILGLPARLGLTPCVRVSPNQLHMCALCAASCFPALTCLLGMVVCREAWTRWPPLVPPVCCCWGGQGVCDGWPVCAGMWPSVMQHHQGRSWRSHGPGCRRAVRCHVAPLAHVQPAASCLKLENTHLIAPVSASHGSGIHVLMLCGAVWQHTGAGLHMQCTLWPCRRAPAG
jgi:hypothetical protein